MAAAVKLLLKNEDSSVLTNPTEEIENSEVVFFDPWLTAKMDYTINL